MLELKLRFTETAAAALLRQTVQRPLKGAVTGPLLSYVPAFPLSQEVRYKHISGQFLFLIYQIPRKATIFGARYIFTPEQGAICGDGEEPKYSGVLHPESTRCLTFRGRCTDT